MARCTNTDAIRLAVEGGGQVKAELVSAGQSGDQSLKRIESAGERASGGLNGLGRQAELLRTGLRTPDVTRLSLDVAAEGDGSRAAVRKESELDTRAGTRSRRSRLSYRFS